MSSSAPTDIPVNSATDPAASPPMRRKPGRPPRAEGARDTREALLRAGLEVLTEKGFAASGLDELLRRVGVPKGSFYYYFDSKEAFGAALIERYAAYFARKLDRHFLDEALSPLARLQAFVDDACAGMARHAFRRGCLVGNLGQEIAALPEAYRESLRAVLADWESCLAACLEAAKEAGELAAGADCTRLAAYFWTGWEGAVLRAKLEGNERALRLFAEGFVATLPRR